MSRKVLVNLDLNGNQLLNVLAQVLATPPVSPAAGQFYYDSALGALRFYTGSAWVNADGSSLRLDQLAAPTADVSLNGHKLTSVADGSASGDGVNKGQLDAAVNGLTWLTPAKALKDTNQAALSGTLTIDGVALASGDRVLLTGQSTPSQNGPWVVAAGAWARPADFAAGEVEPSSDAILVDGGTVYANTGWQISGTANVTVDTTAHTWIQFTGTGDITVVLPIVKTGNTLSLAWTPPKGYAATIGDGAATSISVNHALASTDVVAQIRDASTGAFVECDIVVVDANHVSFTFAVAPANNAYRVAIVALV